MSGPRPEVSAANRRRWAARAAESLPPKPVVVEGSLLAAAKAERGTGAPLVVETLEARLQRCLPGAFVVGGRPCDDTRAPFAVWCRTHRLSTGHSKREAVDKAIALYGGGR